MKQMDMTAFCEGVGAGVLVSLLVKMLYFKKKNRASASIKRALKVAEGAVCALGSVIGF